MSNESVANASLAIARRRQFGLLAIALLNLAIATAMDAVAWSREGSRAATGLLCVFCIFNGILYGQATVLGTLAALIPRRSLVGLVGIGIYAIAFGYAMWVVHVSLSLLARGVPFIGIFFALLAIAMLIVLWGARMLLGWRITAQAPLAEQPRGQFHLADLLELTVLCGAWLGLNLVLENDGVRSRLMVFVFARFIVHFILLGLPVLFAALSQRPPPGWAILAFGLWYVLLYFGLEMIPIHDGGTVASTLRQLPQYAQSSLGFLLAIAWNGLLLRWLGYRWHSQRIG